MNNNLNDPKNIAGLSNLIDEDVESNMNLAELEREIALGAKFGESDDVDMSEEYRKSMDLLARNFDDSPGYTDFEEPHMQASEFVRTEPAAYDDTPQPVEPIMSRNAYNTVVDKPAEPMWSSPRPADEQLYNMTQEEAKQSRINAVLGDIDDRELEFSMEKEREDDDMASLLEQIDMLKITLEDDGVDISGIPAVNKHSGMKDVQTVYKTLRLKNDRNRYCSFAEELILAGAYGLEWMFDGKKIWFGRIPDLTDWSSTVKIKLRRMRYETSTFVQEVMQEYNMTAGVRLALELLPSMFLYSRNRRISQNDNLVSDSEYMNALSELNS